MSFMDCVVFTQISCAPSANNSCLNTATHIIASKMSRSEKMLASIASGKWVLHPSYLTHCMEQNKMLKEDGKLGFCRIQTA
jgi:hypothetical protein